MHEVKMKETIELFKNRKVEFEKIKMKMHCCFGEFKEENVVSLDIIGKINIGFIDFTSLDFEKLRNVNYQNKSENVKIIMGRLKQEMSLVYDLNILLTSEKGYVVQHELQHAFDFFINIKDGNIATEYRAYLAGLKYGGEPVEHLNQIYFSVSKHLNNNTLLNINEMDRSNYLAMAKIASIFSNKRRVLSADRIIRISSELLDESYDDNYGMSYDEIVKVMLKTNKPYEE
jgi:hypothetical protein